MQVRLDDDVEKLVRQFMKRPRTWGNLSNAAVCNQAIRLGIKTLQELEDRLAELQAKKGGGLS